MENNPLKTERTKVKRVPKRGLYDAQSIFDILDSASICHLAFNYQGQAYAMPILYGRDKNFLYLHGATTSRMLTTIVNNSACLTVTLIDGLVLARSAFHHSMNYRSVVLLGCPQLVESEEEKLLGLKAISEHLIKGRWDEVRAPNAKEMKATSVLKFPIEEGSAKVRAEGVKDERADYQLDIWAGIIPVALNASTPIPDEQLSADIPIPNSVKNYML
ncbi:MAG: pyridoxamine 5'-phosphate oxidase family protein [Aureispira sp.]|nr:pyridoxamine 5'-phosphate oxidase family protein [Aureispira sp.]